MEKTFVILTKKSKVSNNLFLSASEFTRAYSSYFVVVVVVLVVGGNLVMGVPKCL